MGDPADLLDRERKTRELLDRLGLPYEVIPITGMTVGGVTVFGLPDGLPIFVDERVVGLDYVILGTGGRNGKVKVSPEVFRRMPTLTINRTRE